MVLLVTGLNFYSLFYTTFFTLCSGFVLISSAYGSTSHFELFSAGEQIIYKFETSVFVNGIEEKEKDVGFLLDGELSVSTEWTSEDKRILKLVIISPKLKVKSKQDRNKDIFISQGSKLDSYKNNPFFVVLNKGKLESIFLSKDEQISLKNLKKGISSLFQFQPWVENLTEIDSSGSCNVSYISASNIRKYKTNCVYNDFKNLKHMDEILGTKVDSKRTMEYTVHQSRVLNKIMSTEKHNVFVHGKKDLGSIIMAKQALIYDTFRSYNTMNTQNFEEAIAKINSLGFVKESFITELEILTTNNERKKFNKQVVLMRDDLRREQLGSIKSAKAFLHLVELARTSTAEEISKALSAKKNSEILSQLYDVLGYAQTQNAYKAVMKFLHLDSEEQTDLIERYLWALSFSTHPNIDIMEDLINKYKKYTKIPDQVRNTLILSLASMARKMLRSEDSSYDRLKVLRNIEETIINGFDYAKDKDRFVFVNALKNLQSPSTIPKLKTILENGTLKEEVFAWRTLKSFGKEFWTPDILKQAEKTLYQLDRKHDTSSCTLAADILLEAGSTDGVLRDLLYFIANNDTNYEIRQYVFQKVKMMSEKCQRFNNRVNDIIKSSKKLNNYASLSPRGLSTALTRSIFSGSSSNGSLISIQEIKGGIVKRGAVDVVLEKDGLYKDIFTLGIFADGLSSFTSSSSDEEEENSTAGMELTVLDTQIRPFVFFEGQGELMGHVWSGTASEMTPAFQALILIQDHEEFLRLGNGFIVKINTKGAVSFDLSGKIELSIWNRNAQSLIQKSVGFLSKGSVEIASPFAESRIESEVTMEPKLKLEIDADFSNKIKLCMKLSQPESILRHTIAKYEQIPESKYQLKFTENTNRIVTGRSYALNRKNSEMCSSMAG